MTNLCEACQDKISFAQELHENFGQDMPFIAVSVLGENQETPISVSQRHRFSFPLLIDPQDEIGKKLGYAHPPDACPFRNVLIMDKRKHVRFKHHLCAVPKDKFVEAVKKVLRS